MIEQLIGPEICGHPVWNLRPTAPKAELTLVPWHQGKGFNGYLYTNVADDFYI